MAFSSWKQYYQQHKFEVGEKVLFLNPSPLKLIEGKVLKLKHDEDEDWRGRKIEFLIKPNDSEKPIWIERDNVISFEKTSNGRETPSSKKERKQNE